eukprot:14729919-Alexandrium_andersonii.AAC.1
MQRRPAQRVGTPGEATFQPSVAARRPKSSSSSSRFQSPAAMHRAVRPRARRASKAQRWAAALSSGSAEGLM